MDEIDKGYVCLDDESKLEEVALAKRSDLSRRTKLE